MTVANILSDKTIVVTGSTSGIGLAAATELARRGAFVIGVGRHRSRCMQAEETIKSACPEARVVFCTADLSSIREVRRLAAEIRDKIAENGDSKLDVLINNAGTFSSWYVSTKEGFELQFAVNHLAPFLLTHELIDLLKAAPSGRVITTSSGSHYRTRINWSDIMLRRRYNCLMAYKQSKLANVLFTRELNRRLGAGSPVRAYAVDPGLVNTDIGCKGTSGLVKWVWKKRSGRGVSPEKAANTIVYLASEPVIENRDEIYWKDCRPCRPSSYSKRDDAALRLWELSERMCGITD